MNCNDEFYLIRFYLTDCETVLYYSESNKDAELYWYDADRFTKDECIEKYHHLLSKYEDDPNITIEIELIQFWETDIDELMRG